MKLITGLVSMSLLWGEVALSQTDDEAPSTDQNSPRRTVIRRQGSEAAPEPTGSDEAPAAETPRSPPPSVAPAKPAPAREAPPSKAAKKKVKKGKMRRGKHVKASSAPAADATPEPPLPAPDATLPAPPPEEVTESPAAPTRAAAAKEGKDEGAFGFNLMPEEKKASPDEQLRLERKVNLRRSMLEWHQALGITTTVLMAGAVVLGQLNYSDRFGGNGSTGQFEIWHSGVEAATVITFAAAGVLALAAPVPYEKKSSGVDPVTIHKYAMLAATIGMVSEVPLGIYTVAREGYADQATLAVIHLVIGYFTAAALGTGVTALFF